MRLLEFYKKIDMSRLDELFIRHKTEGVGRWDVVAHRQNIWMFEYNEWKDILDDIAQFTKIDDPMDARTRPDILTGSFDGRVFYVEGEEDGMDPRVSTYIKKVAQFLGAQKIEMYGSAIRGGDAEEIEDNVEMHTAQAGQGVPEYAWHGTNTSAMPGIIKYGLYPSEGEGNWMQGDVGKFDLNFLTTRWAFAVKHSETSARKQNGVPVILKVKIPDPNLVVPDFDIAVTTGISPEMADQVGYTGSAAWHGQDASTRQQQDTIRKVSGEKVWKQSGVFAYQGRIPANHIVEIMVDFSGEGKAEDMYYGDPYWTFESMEEFATAFELFQDYEYWHPDMEAEIEAQREEDEEYERQQAEDDEEYDESVGGSQAGAGDDSAEYEEHVTQWAQPDKGYGWS